MWYDDVTCVWEECQLSVSHLALEVEAIVTSVRPSILIMTLLKGIFLMFLHEQITYTTLHKMYNYKLDQL